MERIRAPNATLCLKNARRSLPRRDISIILSILPYIPHLEILRSTSSGVFEAQALFE